jgi:hypothetical protein
LNSGSSKVTAPSDQLWCTYAVTMGRSCNACSTAPGGEVDDAGVGRWWTEFETAVRAVHVVVGGVLVGYQAQVTLAEDEHPVGDLGTVRLPKLRPCRSDPMLVGVDAITRGSANRLWGVISVS